MLNRLLDWLYDRKTEKILARASDGDLRARGLAPKITLHQAREMRREIER